MKKVIAFLLALFLTTIFIVRAGIVAGMEIHANYADTIGGLTTENKFKSLDLLTEAAMKGDNLFLFGSSELEKIKDSPFHPTNFFRNKKGGFQVNLVGKAGYTDLVHAITFSALGSGLKGQKVVFILSPQWFVRSGVSQKTFLACSSEEEIYAMFFSKTLTPSLKARFAKRISGLMTGNSDFLSLKLFCRLYSQDNFVSRAMLFVLNPYYRFRYYLLSTRDRLKSVSLLGSNPAEKESEQVIPGSFQWSKEIEMASDYGKKAAGNNPFSIDSHTYKAMQKNMSRWEKATGRSSYVVSPEYGDLQLLLDVCRDQGIHPLIVSIPVNGYWYDYCGFGKSGRMQYYQNVKRIIASYGFEFCDLSGHEYDRYFLCDATHLGWKGWVYVNEAIDHYYKEKSKG